MKSRREFIATTAATAALGFADLALPHRAWGSPMGLPIGIQLYTVRQALQADPAGTLDKLHAIGYREVETAGFAGKSAKEFRALLDAADLVCPSAHLNFNTADLGPVFQDAHTLGAAYATSSMLATMLPIYTRKNPNGQPTSVPPLTLDDFKKLTQRMNQLGHAAKAAGLQYAYHNHNIEFVKLPDGSFGYDLLLRETDHELVKFEADCGWLTIAGADPVTYFKQYPGRFRMIHVKDFQPMQHPSTTLFGTGRPEGAELGRGFIKYQRIFDAGKVAGIQHAFAEQEGPYQHSELESAKVDYDFLKSFS